MTCATTAALVAHHFAGLPLEELLLAGFMAAAPMLALVGWEVSRWISRLRKAMRGWVAGAQREPHGDGAAPPQ